MEILGYIASIFIGIVLGLIGAGGSIMTVPIMVYLFKINPELATVYSLFIVGITALFGAIRYYRQGNIELKTALAFTLPSIITLLSIRKFLMPIIPKELFPLGNFLVSKDLLIMLVFAVLMILASISMIKSSGKESKTEKPSLAKLILLGLMVGVITGILGAGGGFMIIPALVIFGGLEMKTAVGTSLLIISINTLIGFAGDMINGISIDIKLLTLVTIFAILGMFLGTQLAKKIPGDKLKPIFGWFVLLMGIYIIIKEVILN